MIKLREQIGIHVMRDPQIIARLCVRAEASPDSDLWSNGSLKNWFARLAFEAAPFAVIVAGFVVQVWIARQTDGIIYNLLILQSILLEIALIWVWNRADICKELSCTVQETHNNMKVFVQLFGQARRLSGAKKASLHVEPQASLRDVFVDLGQRFPALMDELIVPDSCDLKAPYVINVEHNGRYTPASLEELVHDGERLILLFMSVGSSNNYRKSPVFIWLQNMHG